ncbi:MAG TPA: M48 family metalloprotease [Actinopolymorphaceae bacterium]|nr:M48 family metalloprotease [Actinopolymorphaceae bacterium]
MHDRAHRHRNQLKTTLLLAVLSGLLVFAGLLLGGGRGLVIAAVVAAAVNAGAYFGSDRIALRSMRARPASEADRPELCGVVRELATAMRLPIPAVYVSPTATPTAFATGRNPRRATICVTEGLLALLDPRELRGVIGHELGHIASRDILVSSVAAAVASMMMYAAQFGWRLHVGGGPARARNRLPVRARPVGVLLLLLLAPPAASVVRLAITRSREYAADATSARVTGDPLALASALRKLELTTRQYPLPAEPELRSVAALMIMDPFCARGLVQIFATHPPADERIERLEALGGGPGHRM